jgi:hypothetical protein
MRVPTIKIDRREYVLVPKAEYQQWKRRNKSAKNGGSSKSTPIELYTDQRVAEFLLTNTVDAKDYARACKLVRKMGLNPAKIDHDKPVGVD